MTTNYELYEVDGDLYALLPNGDVFSIDFTENSKEYEKTTSINDIKALNDDYENINDEISKLKADMNDWGKKRGVVIEKETRKEAFAWFKNRKNKLKLKKDIVRNTPYEDEEDLFEDYERRRASKDYEQKKKMYFSDFNEETEERFKFDLQDTPDFSLDGKTKENLLSETSSKPKYFLEC